MNNNGFVFNWWIRTTYICLLLGCWKIAEFNFSFGGFEYCSSRLSMANKPVYNLSYDKYRGIYSGRDLLIDWRDSQMVERDADTESHFRKTTKPNFEDFIEFQDYVKKERGWILSSRMNIILAARTNIHSRLKPVFHKNPGLKRIEWHQFLAGNQFIYPEKFFEIKTIGIDDIEIQREVLHLLADLKDIDYKDFFGDNVKVVVTQKEITLEVMLDL